jgi:hypothetical protein
MQRLFITEAACRSSARSSMSANFSLASGAAIMDAPAAALLIPIARTVRDPLYPGRPVTSEKRRYLKATIVVGRLGLGYSRSSMVAERHRNWLIQKNRSRGSGG